MTQSLREMVQDRLIDVIRSKKWKPGHRLPSERALAKELGVSRVTLREALRHLEAEGFLTREPGTNLRLVAPPQSRVSKALSPVEAAFRLPADDDYQQGLALHRQGNMAQARMRYAQALERDGDRPPSDEEFAAVLAHAPRLFTTPTEPLPLKDVVAIVHPDLPLIGYHLFWEDDIDYPADNDPCDHEVLWVLTDADRKSVQNVYAFYHGAVIRPREAAVEANEHGGRPRVDVQWGKHGSLIVGWQSVANGLILEDMQLTYERLTVSCRDADHPLAREWPDRFEGSWDDFIGFDVEVDPRPLLEKKKMVRVSRLANASIAWNCLRYCFSVKYSWPDTNVDAELCPAIY